MWWHDAPMPVVDTHADSLGDVVRGVRRLGERSQSGQLDFPRMEAGGGTIQFLSCWVEAEYKPERAGLRQLQYLDAFWRETEANRGKVEAVLGTADWLRVLQTNVLGVIPSVEGAEAVGTDPAMVRILYRLGVRLMSLTWNQRNALADGAGEDPGGGGVSRAGREILREMNRVGMVIDVSHLAEAGFWDVLEISSAPVIASHSNCRRLAQHRRNLSDGQIRALAQNGGVQGITFVRPFLGAAADRDRVIDHIIHVLTVTGDDRHVGLGSDFDGVEDPVPGLEDVTRLPQLADRMSERGLPDTTIRRVFGQNYQDFFLTAWGNRRS
ncbi:MAG: dipeptidase [Thermaerobacter sp.]|nr:dipeptidase [Thermaerobacter sp.]